MNDPVKQHVSKMGVSIHIGILLKDNSSQMT